MKRSILFILILSFLVLPNCFFTDISDVRIIEITGSGSYDSATNLSTLSVYFRIGDKNLIHGTMSDWIFSLVSDREFLDIITLYLKKNYRWYLCEGVECDNLYVEDDMGHVLLEVTKTGDIFKGRDPNKIEVQVLITDENENGYNLNDIVDFEFTRN